MVYTCPICNETEIEQRMAMHLEGHGYGWCQCYCGRIFGDNGGPSWQRNLRQFYNHLFEHRDDLLLHMVIGRLQEAKAGVP